MPIGDVQFGAEGCDVDRFKRHMERGLQAGAYFLGMGDYVDVASPSNRQRIRTAALYDSVSNALEEKAQEHVEKFLRLVRGSEGKWLGLLSGHHYWDFSDGTTSDTRLAAALKAPFLGTCAGIRLLFQEAKHQNSCVIWAHHGRGSGAKQSAPLNKLETVTPGFDADIYLIAHHHKIAAAKYGQLYMTHTTPPALKQREKVIAGTGGFLRGYLQGSKQGGIPAGTYVEQGMMMPVALGGITLKIKPVRSSEADHIEIFVEQ